MSRIDVPPPDTTPAACAGTDPDLWFRLDGEPADAWALRARAARAICAVCPIRPDCLAWALEVREQHGVWGGLDEDERRALLRRRVRGVKVA